MPVSKKRPAQRTSSARRRTDSGYTDRGKGVALYHVMRAGEDFETTADALFQLVRNAARDFPSRPRHLYLDVEGHRNAAGGYDKDAYELYSSFILGYLGQFLTEVPLIEGRARRDGQREDMPEHLAIVPSGEGDARADHLRERASRTGLPVWDADTGNTVHPDGTVTPPTQAGPAED